MQVPTSQKLAILTIGGSREAYIAYSKNPETDRITISAMLEKRPGQPVRRILRTAEPQVWRELRADLVAL